MTHQMQFTPSAEDDEETDIDTSEDRTVVTRMPVAPEPRSTPPAQLDTPHTPPSLPSHPRGPAASVPPVLSAPVMVPATTSLDAPQRFESSPPEIASTPVQWVAPPPPDATAPASRRGLVIALAVIAALSVLSAIVAARTRARVTPSIAPIARVPARPPPVAQPVEPAVETVTQPVVEADAAIVEEPAVEPVVTPVATAVAPRAARVTTPRGREPARSRVRPPAAPTTVTEPPPPPRPHGEYEIP